MTTAFSLVLPRFWQTEQKHGETYQTYFSRSSEDIKMRLALRLGGEYVHKTFAPLLQCLLPSLKSHDLYYENVCNIPSLVLHLENHPIVARQSKEGSTSCFAYILQCCSWATWMHMRVTHVSHLSTWMHTSKYTSAYSNTYTQVHFPVRT